MSKKHKGIETLKTRYGYYFISPWIFGVILFFIVPLITSMLFSFSTVRFSSEGLSYDIIGLKHYRDLLLKSPTYVNELVASISSIFTSLPIIVALSLILAIVLNQKFKGRIFMRAIYFLPVIIASGPVMSCMMGAGNFGVSNSSQVSMASASFMEVIDFNELLLKLNLPKEMSDLISKYLTETFNLIWGCGVQSILFIAGLQSIPEQLYEVGKVEGATVWETFWYITIPMLGQVILLVIFYTMIELFVTKGSLVQSALYQMSARNNFDNATAQLWIFFVVILVFMGIVVGAYNKFALKRWE